jgi:hypothetical protein
MLGGSLSPQPGASSGLRMEERPPAILNIEQAPAGKRQGMILQLGG